MRLDGELVLVTGSTAGIGRAIALRCASEGAAVAVHGRDAERGEAVVDEIVAAGGTAVLVLGDLGDEAECGGIVERGATALGGLTVLVNNAAGGGGGDGPVGEITTAAWESVLRVDLTAPMWLCRAAIPQMIKAGHGAIVNISSRQGHRASRGLSAYIAAKGGLDALTRSIAVDYAERGIRCNTVSPGYVLNDRRDADLAPDRRARFEGMHLSRLGVADYVAHACVYLASRESEWLTGHNLHLDGGSTIARGLTLG